MNVERRAGLSYAEFEREYLLPRRPVILVDVLGKCPAATKWTPDYFKNLLGSKVVSTDGGPMRIDEVIDGIVKPGGVGRAPFLRERPVPWVLPELLSDLEPFPVHAAPNWFEYPFARWADPFRYGFGAMLNRLAQTDINVTGAGMSFPVLHLDRFHCHALIMQWHGRKEFFVFAPDQTPYLYPNANGDVSTVDSVENPDLERFPLFAKAKMVRLTLNPGEALFNPSGWWHTTRTLDPSIATVISFGNRSNWNEVIRHMIPKGRLGLLKLAPFAAYLFLLGLFRLPGYEFENPAKVATAKRAFQHFQRIRGQAFASTWEIGAAFGDPAPAVNSVDSTKVADTAT